MLGKKDKSNPGKAFGEILRELRKKAKLTQEQLAFEAGIERNYVSLIELGKNQPTITTLFKLALALHIEPHRLIQLTQKKLTLKCNS